MTSVAGHAPAPGSAGPTDSLTFSFGDGSVFGLARLGLADGLASGLALLFADETPVTVRAEGMVEATGPASWEQVRAAGIAVTASDDERVWRVVLAGRDGEPGFDVRFEAIGPSVATESGDAAARAGGMVGTDLFGRVTGVAAGREIDGLGQLGRSWGAPDWERMELVRTISAWLGDGRAIEVAAVRPAGAKGHDREASTAFVLDPAREEPIAIVEEALVSTGYDGAGHQRRAGLELRLVGDDWPVRASGEVLCGTSLDLGRLRLDCAFFAWEGEGREGYGRYDILRRA